MRHADVAVVGAGAAGLMAAIRAGREGAAAGRPLGVTAIDGARTLGAKILVAGGGRCNVTHDTVTERDFSGSSPAAIRKVLRAFDVPATTAFFREIGVDLVREPGGKLFPATGRGRTVLDALLRAAAAAGVTIVHPWRAETVERTATGFEVRGASGRLAAGRVILATGGRSLPRSGSDGLGLAVAQSLGHTIRRTFPALVPLVVAEGHWIRSLPGVAADARVEVRASSGRILVSTIGPVLCTHFGLSGPAILDASRHLLAARETDAGAGLVVGWIPSGTAADLGAEIVAAGGRSAAAWLRRRLPDRLAEALCRAAGVDPGAPCSRIPRGARRSLAEAAAGTAVPVTGDRGFTHAEATAGGVPLGEVRLETLESRVCPGLHLCGEILDVDGRIGGFNFQWAWSSGVVAGRGAAGHSAAVSSRRSGGTMPDASR